jgi:NAD(P)-dependent dehydrogenase (short-subunit alcohol dehydrogenase family)
MTPSGDSSPQMATNEGETRWPAIAGTEGVERMAPTDADKARWLECTALRRFGTTTDIANAALYLSSDAGGFVTGAIFDCDGGMSLGDASGNHLLRERR